MRMCHFRAQNDPFVLNKVFLVQSNTITFIFLLALFIVQTLKKFLPQIQRYWNLIGQETFSAKTWEPDFYQAWGFPRMLMNHKNFHFTQIPVKNNDVIFLKSSKTLVLGHLWPF